MMVLRRSYEMVCTHNTCYIHWYTQYGNHSTPYGCSIRTYCPHLIPCRCDSWCSHHLFAKRVHNNHSKWERSLLEWQHHSHHTVHKDCNRNLNWRSCFFFDSLCGCQCKNQIRHRDIPKTWCRSQRRWKICCCYNDKHCVQQPYHLSNWPRYQ